MSDRREEPGPTILADIDAERSLLGALLVDNGILERAGVQPGDFSDPAHRQLWETSTKIIHRGERLSAAVLSAAVPTSQRYISKLTPAANGNAAADARTIRDFAARRRLVEIAAALHEAAGDTSAPADEIAANVAGNLMRLRAGKEALEHEQRRQERKLATLRAAIAEGDASPDAEPGVFDRIRAKFGLPAAR